jgi:zeaxanthin glucosyltransferase
MCFLPAVGRVSEIQVVLAKGNNIEHADLFPIPSNVIVVDQAPQIELLKRATLCITHAELNTALIRRVLNTHSYREKAQYFKNIIAQRRGPESAAGTIERAFEAALADCALEPARS